MDENSLISINGNGMPTLQILLMMTIIPLLPSIVVMMTSFMRIVIIPVLHEKCDWCSADSSQYGPHRACAVSYLIYYESGAERNQ